MGSRPRGYKTFIMFNSTEQVMYSLINDKMSTIVGILTFISMINTTFVSLTARTVFIFQHFSKQIKFHAMLS